MSSSSLPSVPRSYPYLHSGVRDAARTAVFLDWGFVERSVRSELGVDAAAFDLDPTKLATELVTHRKWASGLSATAILDGIHDRNRRPGDYLRATSRAQRWAAAVNTTVHLHPLQYLPSGEFRQKQVDVELALQMVEAARSGNCDAIIVFTGDGDLLPAAKRVVAEGVRFESACWGYRSGLRVPEVKHWTHNLDIEVFRRIATPRHYRCRGGV
ncbi:NYN domain-containing protein [Rhodococcus qingshengii]|uniref:NYN domain-containing protein n=1 Tax=Rhodococcus qingshengii TaxID=334542 RepID=UPI0035E1D440